MAGIFFTQTSKELKGVICCRNILHINTDKIIQLLGRINDFMNKIETAFLVKQESHLGRFDRQIPVEVLAFDGLQYFEGIVFKADRLFKAGNELAKDVYGRHHALLIQFTCYPNCICKGRACNIALGKVADNRFWDMHDGF